MVRVADDIKEELAAIGTSRVAVNLTGASGMWSDFNEANKEAMLKSELISWPVTMAILVLAFGSLVAAGLPLMLTILGLVAAAGSLWFARSQATVYDVAYMKAMIPHHSLAITRSERAGLTDVRVCRLAVEISEAQRREIDEMEWLIQDIAENGVKACQDAAKIHKCPESLAGMPPADGVILADPNWGLGVITLIGLDPAVEVTGAA